MESDPYVGGPQVEPGPQPSVRGAFGWLWRVVLVLIAPCLVALVVALAGVGVDRLHLGPWGLLFAFLLLGPGALGIGASVATVLGRCLLGPSRLRWLPAVAVSLVAVILVVASAHRHFVTSWR